MKNSAGTINRVKNPLNWELWGYMHNNPTGRFTHNTIVHKVFIVIYFIQNLLIDIFKESLTPTKHTGLPTKDETVKTT